MAQPQPARRSGMTVAGFDVLGVAEFVGFVVADILAFVKHASLPFDIAFMALAFHGLHHATHH